MKSIWIAGVMCLTLAGIVALGQRTTGRGTVLPAPESGPGAIQGIVRRPDTKEPIANATVTLRTGPGARAGQSTAITDINGRFRFGDVALGTYTIQTIRAGYFVDGVVTGRTQVQPTLARTDTTVSTNQTTANIVLELIPGGTVTGRVFDPSGQLMTGVQVAPLLEGYQDGHRALFTTSGTVTSDDRGEFRISGLAPGQYRIFAWESIPLGAERNAQFMERFEQNGRALSVTAGSTSANIVVPLIRTTR